MNPNSLANLNPKARYKGKERANLTLLPETIEWLKKSGNASDRVDELVALAKSGKIKPDSSSGDTHNQNQANPLVSDNGYEQKQEKSLDSDNTHNQKEDNSLVSGYEHKLNEVQTKLDDCQEERQRLEKQVTELQECVREAETYQGLADTLKYVENALRGIVVKSEAKQTGYKTNSFGKGLQALKGLLGELG